MRGPAAGGPALCRHPASPAHAGGLRTLLTSPSGVQVQKTQRQITLFCERWNKLLTLLWHMGVVCCNACRPKALCDQDCLFFAFAGLPTPIRHFLCYQSQDFSQHSLWVQLHLRQHQLGIPLSLILRAGTWNQMLSCYEKYSCCSCNLAAGR